LRKKRWRDCPSLCNSFSKPLNCLRGQMSRCFPISRWTPRSSRQSPRWRKFGRPAWLWPPKRVIAIVRIESSSTFNRNNYLSDSREEAS
jgi:hypothetical protein